MKENNSYKSILKSTSLVGGSQIIKIIFNLIRNKFIALILGPSGIGLISTFSSTLELISKISGMGVETSAVRDVAKLNTTNDENEVYKTIYTLRKLSIILGIIGTALCFIFADKISIITFEERDYTFEIRALSVIIFLHIIYGSQTALLQGKRLIKQIVKINLLGSIIGTIFSIPLIYFFEFDGIVPYLIIVAIAQLVFSWIFSKNIAYIKPKITLSEFFIRSKSMLILGFTLMLSSMVTVMSFYIIRVIIIRYLDIQSVGIYQASFALSSVYIAFILDAMGKDFYPRLTASVNNSAECKKIINEQTYIGLLMTAPIVIFTLALSPYIINFLYTSEFYSASHILKWQIFGVFLQVISWPLGYYLIAKGKGKLYFLTQLLFSSLHIVLTFIAIKIFGLIGTGIAFLILYLIYTILMKILIYRDLKLKWSINISVYILFFSFIFIVFFILLENTSPIIGSAIVSFAGIFVLYFNLKKIMQIMHYDKYSDLFQVFLRKVKKRNSKRDN